MKTAALIWALYILFLALLPSFNILPSSPAAAKRKVNCCTNKSAGEKSASNSGKDCSKKNCTPFFGCTKIQLFVSKTTLLHFISIIFKEKFITPSETSRQLFVSDHWHPPQLI